MTVTNRCAAAIFVCVIGMTTSIAYAHEHASHARPQKEKAVGKATGTPVAESASLKAASVSGELYIISPRNGDAVTSPVRVQFGLKGMGVAPAGVDAPNTGHHHLLIDVEEMPPFNAPLPATKNVIHFGGGQTETSVELEPGIHSLQLLLGNFIHVPHNPPIMSEQIQIKVVAP